ncbi:hypothetical protein F4V43_01960 [Paenibacillus spiritus]|uniref:Uncharacterized protein n=1 Tax=Paenibacillus spiritus TaxID=2496557 RepID=A0A5J5GIE2_9BACL|nr:hypothetical protein [Paenibacillus spiritus]KAA9007274.1 hypothetical protein F4V43_01960 [Paenibacillus spiritus]
MNMKEQYNLLVQSAIDKNIGDSQSEFGFLNARLTTYNVFTFSNVKVKFSTTDQSVEVIRLDNDNPVFCRNASGEIYRIHGEVNRVREALESLANN